jgi:hypothetical protein
MNDADEAVIQCTTGVQHKTGVEMEALVGASIAALTIYDMCKALSHEMAIVETARGQARRQAGLRNPLYAGHTLMHDLDIQYFALLREQAGRSSERSRRRGDAADLYAELRAGTALRCRSACCASPSTTSSASGRSACTRATAWSSSPVAGG